MGTGNGARDQSDPREESGLRHDARVCTVGSATAGTELHRQSGGSTGLAERALQLWRSTVAAATRSGKGILEDVSFGVPETAGSAGAATADRLCSLATAFAVERAGGAVHHGARAREARRAVGSSGL